MALLWIVSVNGHAFIALSSEWIKQFVKVFYIEPIFCVKLFRNKYPRNKGVVEVS